MTTLAELTSEELFFGHAGCAGCGSVLAVRQALKVLGRNVIFVEPAGCVLGVTCFYPQVALRVPLLPTAFPATASTASGVSVALKAKGRHDVKVVAVAGDGGTADIGLQALSGAVERGDELIYICTDNEAYMNTGIQRSGLTPWGATTTTTPGGKLGHREDKSKKDMMAIVAAHGIPYAATASISHWNDFLQKVEKAYRVKGPSFLHVLAPCPPGWGFDTSQTVKFARLAVQTGIWPLYEIENGKYRITLKIRNFKPVREYVEGQGRFRGLSEAEVAHIESLRDQQWANINSIVEVTNK
ncbi:Thiamin diphosphate-binding fold [Moorella glycerini]|uniref:Pyruvate synthase subunit PorB n=1 Tax=Neomoorella stamsii TaxID=1266720 RepID=A0A9X7P7E5_9FIRM|nr:MULTISPECIES: thiamine pyrophosphate-dependent enzyme [Moorella]PRR77112.1 Pyruvate synthase subunit PorB [Moorella stamsii]CEP66861.1 Thiamin diphosphate-binding fold [Moorella glycerini]